MYKIILVALITSLLFMSCNANNDKSTTLMAKNEEVKAEQIIKAIDKGEHVYIVNSDIIGNLDFSELTNKINIAEKKVLIDITSSLSFINCTFKGEIIANKNKGEFYHTTLFEKNISFINCKLKETVNLRESEFRCPVNFSGCEFYKDAYFEGTSFHNRNNYFSETKFFGKVRFQNAFFYGSVNFIRAEFNDVTSFQLCSFMNEAQFSSIQFAKYTDFGKIKTNGGIYFNYTQFGDKAIFSNSIFNNRTEFMDAKFKKDIVFKDACFNNSVSFNNCNIDGICTFENALFLLGNPSTKGIKIKDTENLNFNNVRINKLANFKKEEFITN